MNWEALKKNICPKCGEILQRKFNENYNCGRCGFFCRVGKARNILRDINEKEFDKEADDFLRGHNCYIPKY